MNWKKIAVLAFVLALLSATIVFVNQKEKAMMDEDVSISQIIDQLALILISVETDDVMALGNMLKQIDLIEKAAEQSEVKGLQPFGLPIKKLIEKMIFKEWDDPQQALDVISNGIRIIQNKIAHGEPNQPLPEENHHPPSKDHHGYQIDSQYYKT